MRLFVDNLTNVDFSYLCPTRGLVGETWLAHIELIGKLDHQGMVCDFGVVKKQLRHWLDEQLDHRLLVPAAAPEVQQRELGLELDVTLNLGTHGSIHTRSPIGAITLVDAPQINCASVAQWCMQKLQGVFGAGVEQIRLSFSPEEIAGPFYHYSHGLKKHQGNCQRIAHGHRSRIMIWRDGILCLSTMQAWADKWRDIYIASSEDCIGKDDTSASFAYTSQQGEFSLTLPRAQCYFMDTDTTVEHIARHLAHVISREHLGERIRVKAFEGVSKGAIAEATANG